MRKKYFASICSAMLAGLMISSQTVAAEYATKGDDSTAVFSKTITLSEGTDVPVVAYNYTVTSGSAIAGTESTMNIYAGNDPVRTNGVLPDNMSISFSALDNGSVADNKIRKAAVVDFSNTEFYSPGVYRYVIEETGNAAGIVEAADRIFACDVYVMDDSGTLKVGGYIIHTDETSGVERSDTEVVLDDKIEGLTASFNGKSLTINKVVSGNQGVRNEYFPFAVELKNMTPGTQISVDLSGADATTTVTAFNADTHTNPATLTADETGTVTATYWLMNGQAITINELADTVQYSIQESENVGDTGYTTTIETTGDVDGVVEDESAKKTSDTAITDNTTVVYTNTKGGVVPTGLFMTIGGAAALTLIGLAGVISLLAKSKKA